MKPKTVMTIAGSDSGGGAGIQADLKTFSAFEIHGVSAITSVTAQNSKGVQNIHNLPAEIVGEQIDSIMDDFKVEWAKTGMISKKEIIKTVLEKTKEHELNLVVDPVMVSASGDSLLEMGAFGPLKDLISEAKLVTPNIHEAEELADMKIDSIEKMKDSAAKISRIGAENVLVKGGHLDTDEIINVLLYENDFLEFRTERVEASEIHGTGCTFSSAITSFLAKNEDIKNSVKKAGDFMVDAVKRRLQIGGGSDTINPMARHWKLAPRNESAYEVREAARKLVNKKSFSKLVPQVGTNIVKAPKNAQRVEDVVGLSGRIVLVDERPRLTGVPKKGGSKHMGSFILSVIKHDMSMRSGMNIKYSEKILAKCKDLGYKIGEFDRGEEPDDSETMEWGPDQVVEKLGELPDIIYDTGDIGKEPMIRIIGESPLDVSEKAIRIMREIEK